MIFYGRKKPYTEIGISRVPCIRCHEPSVHQWNVCVNDNRWVGVCTNCDVLLNTLALDFMGVPNKDELLTNYLKNL